MKQGFPGTVCPLNLLTNTGRPLGWGWKHSAAASYDPGYRAGLMSPAACTWSRTSATSPGSFNKILKPRPLQARAGRSPLARQRARPAAAVRTATVRASGAVRAPEGRLRNHAARYRTLSTVPGWPITPGEDFGVLAIQAGLWPATLAMGRASPRIPPRALEDNRQCPAPMPVGSFPRSC